MLGASESLSYSQVSFKFIQNGLYWKYIIQTYTDDIYKHPFHVCIVLMFVDINDAPKL